MGGRLPWQDTIARRLDQVVPELASRFFFGQRRPSARGLTFHPLADRAAFRFVCVCHFYIANADLGV
jgi:hypothetical protein